MAEPAGDRPKDFFSVEKRTEETPLEKKLHFKIEKSPPQLKSPQGLQHMYAKYGKNIKFNRIYSTLYIVLLTQIPTIYSMILLSTTKVTDRNQLYHLSGS